MNEWDKRELDAAVMRSAQWHAQLAGSETIRREHVRAAERQCRATLRVVSG